MQINNLSSLYKQLLKTLFSLLLLLMALQFAPISFAKALYENKSLYEDIESIRHDVAKMLEEHYAQSKDDTRIEINIANLDSRLQLARCAESKTMKINSSKRFASNISVRISCQGQAPWSIFVPVKIDFYQKVAVTTRDIFKDEIITTADVTLQESNISNTGFGFAKKIEPLIGHAVTRNLTAGSIVRLSQISDPVVVNRGDKITLESSISGLTVAASAIAMSKGKVGDQIRVKNQQSKRVIEAYITAPGKAVANL